MFKRSHFHHALQMSPYNHQAADPYEVKKKLIVTYNRKKWFYIVLLQIDLIVNIVIISGKQIFNIILDGMSLVKI